MCCWAAELAFTTCPSRCFIWPCKLPVLIARQLELSLARPRACTFLRDCCLLQFERTLIVAEDDSYVSYLEGCTAPSYDKNQVQALCGTMQASNQGGRPAGA